MAKNQKLRWAIFGIAVLLIINMQNTMPKEAFETVEGQACTEETAWDVCGCIGKIEAEPETLGIGYGRCIDGVCDTTYCLNVKPVGDWLEEHPWQWIKDSPLMAALIGALLLLAIFWPD